MLSCYSRWTLTREREKIGTKKETETVREEEEEEEEEERQQFGEMRRIRTIEY